VSRNGPPLIVVQDRADAAVLGELGIAAEPEQVEVERLVRLPFAVVLHFDRDLRLAGVPLMPSTTL
jgi:hypothetical protein